MGISILVRPTTKAAGKGGSTLTGTVQCQELMWWPGDSGWLQTDKLSMKVQT